MKRKANHKYICLVLLSRGVLAQYIKTLNKSLGLIYLFLEHYNSEKMKDKLITIENFMMFLKYDKKIINNMLYWYDLGDDFSKAKKEIEMIMKARYDELSQNKDNATSYLIFYGKNKFGMTDKGGFNFSII